MHLTEHSFFDLIDIVHSNDRCVECGACIAVCPFQAIISKDFIINEEQLKKGKKIELQNSFHIFYEEKCTNCSLCVKSCPVVNWDINKAEKKIFGNTADNVLGNFIEIWEAKAKDKDIYYNSQTGGVTTAILNYLLDKKIIDCALVTTGEKWKAKPFLAFNKNELKESQKTKYAKSHILELLSIHSQEILNQNYAAVFTPCQIHGFYTMKENSYRGKQFTEKAQLLIGTFCYGTYDIEKVLDYLKEREIETEKIIKMEIDKELMRIYTDKGLVFEESRHEIYPFLHNSCKFCHDLTSVIADISVGAIGAKDNYTTIIIRTERGRKIFQDAMNNGYISGNKISSYYIEEIKKLGQEKIVHGVKEIVEKRTEFSNKVVVKSKGRWKGIFSRKKKTKKFEIAKDIISIYVLSDAGVPMFTYPQNEEQEVLISGIFGALTLLINSMSRGNQFLKEVNYSNMTLMLEQREGLIVALLVKKSKNEIRDKLNSFADELAKETVIFERGQIEEVPNQEKMMDLITKNFQ